MSATAAIDPRFRQRLVSVRRAEGRRRLRWASGLVGVLTVAAMAAAASQSALLDLDHLEVSGAARTTPDEVLGASGLADGGPLINLDLDDAERAVAELPWVAEVDLVREWPATVRAEITERVPVAALARTDGSWALADLDGRVLATVAERPAGAVAVGGFEAGPDGAQLDDAVGPALAAAAAVPPELRSEVAEVAAGPEGDSVAGVLTTGGVVDLGPPTDLDAKWLAVLTIIDAVGAECIATLDVRVPDGPLLTRAAVCR